MIEIETFSYIFSVIKIINNIINKLKTRDCNNIPRCVISSYIFYLFDFEKLVKFLCSK